MEKAIVEENVIYLPWNIITSHRAFALDIGNTLLKLCYIAREDWNEPSHRSKESQCRWQLISFPKENLDNALQIIKTQCLMKENEDPTLDEVFITGSGSQQLKEQIELNLSIESTVIGKTSCFVQAMLYMMNYLPQEKFLHTISKPAFKFASHQAEQSQIQMAAIKEEDTPGLLLNRVCQPGKFIIPQEVESGENQNKTLTEVAKDLFPFGLAICGSGILFIVVNEDGTYEILNSSTQGGCMFAGLGRLLTQVKNYTDLIALCEDGNAGAVDLTVTGLNKKFVDGNTDEENVYARIKKYEEKVADELVVYSFGLAAEKDLEEFKKEDLAQCLLRNIIDSTVQSCLSCARIRSLKHVFFTGSFVDQPLVRSMITLAWLKRDIRYHTVSPKQAPLIQVHFPQHASYLGAIGALMNQTELLKQNTSVIK